MKATFSITALAAAALAAAGAWAQAQPPSGATGVKNSAPLTQAADALRESIQGMEEQHPEDERVGSALEHARNALVETQNAIAGVVIADMAAEEARKEAEEKAAAQAKAGAVAQKSAPPAGAQAPATADGAGDAIAAASGQPANGCWARLHEQPDYGGKALTLAGGTDVSEVARSLGGDWQGIGSVVVGPGAQLVTRKKDLFGEATMTIAQGQELPDVTRTEPPGLFASIDQMEIACTG